MVNKGGTMNSKQKKADEQRLDCLDVAFLLMVCIVYFLASSAVIYLISYFLGE